MLTKNYNILIFLCVLVIVAYFKVIFFDFLYWDDDKQIINNNYVKILSIDNIKHNFKFERFTFIPLMLYSITYNIVGQDPKIYHLISILFHIVNTILFFVFIRKILNNESAIRFSTLLFALHPLRIESVAWISEWKDLLFTMFALLALINYVNLINTKKLRYFWLYVLFCWLSGYSKIQGMLIPFCAILIDYFKFKTLFYDRMLINLTTFVFVFSSFDRKYVIFLLIALIFVFTIFKQSGVIRFYKVKLLAKNIFFVLFLLLTTLIAYFFITKKVWFWEHNLLNNIDKRLFYFFYALAFYIKQFFLPLKQIPIHNYPINFKHFFLENIIPTVVVLLLFLIIIIFLTRYLEKNIIVFGLLFFLLNISIVLHIIPIEGRLVVAERYTYFAYIGLFLITSQIYQILNEKTRKYIFYLIATLFSILIFFRVNVWKDTETLFNYVLKNNNKVPFAWNNLGSYYLQKNNPKKAIFMYKQSIKIDSLNAENYFNLAMAYAKIKNYDMAIKLLNIAINKTPYPNEKSFYLTTIGQIYENIGEITEALKYYDTSLVLFNKNVKAMLQKAFYYLNNGLVDSAEILAKRIVRINKYYFEAYNLLGFIELKYKRNFNKSIEYFNKVLKFNNLYAVGYNNRGYAYLTLGDYNNAIKDFSFAIKLDSTFYEAYRNRAFTYFTIKNYAKAIKDYSIVLSKINNDTIALFNRAHAYSQIGLYDSAINDYLKIINLKYNNSAAFELAKCYIKQKKYDLANYYLTSLEKKVNSNVLVKVYKGISLFYLNQIDSALYYFNQTKDISINKGEVYFWIGECYRIKKDIKSACENYSLSFNYGFKEVNKNIVKYCKKFYKSDNF
ncbi:MAG: tetratricopeptide repeat protein [Bacteroidales bacterium]|nr:tetratricopeptide repeat protein [Bacteroidales bacterium]